MSSSNAKVVAILTSDIHLSIKAPVARSAEPDWFKAMARPLKELSHLSAEHNAPVIYAGDIFHLWNSPPELINFALEHLPKGYAVPGQHDLPYHNINEMDRSAFGTLLRFGKIKLLDPKTPKLINGVWVWGFPWGTEITPIDPSEDDAIQLAVVHAYIWQKGASYPGAKETQRVNAYRYQLRGYDVAVFGDNHKPFLTDQRDDQCTIFNHGAFLRRNIDEIQHQPRVGLLMSDGAVKLHALDCELDKFIPKESAKFEEKDGFEMSEFLKELHKLGSTNLDFVEAVEHYLDQYEVSKGAKKIIKQAIDHDLS